MNAVPADRPAPTAVPLWWRLHPEIPECKCMEIDQLSLASRIGYEGAERLFLGRDEGNLAALRCRFEVKRRGGCTKGAECEFCHVHPFGKHEVDMSCVVPDPSPGKPQQTRKLHRHERQERKAKKGEENQERREYWARLVQAAQEDARFNVQFGRPVGPRKKLHFAVWSVHKLLEESRPTVEYHEHLFELQPGDVGLWLGVDSLSQNDDQYPVGEAHGVHTLMKGLATRLRRQYNQTGEFIFNRGK